MDPTSEAHLTALLQLGKTTYPVIAFSGEEAINQPYQFKIQLPSSDALESEEILGKTCQLVLSASKSAKGLGGWPSKRHLVGLITRQRLLKPSPEKSLVVELILEPRLALLRFSSQARVYRNMSARDVVKTTLLRHGYDETQLNFHDSWPNKPIIYPNWVQAQEESDFDFIHRVLAREGISYFWANPDESHQEALLFYDYNLLHPHHNSPFFLSEADGLATTPTDRLYKLSVKETPASFRVSYKDYNPKNPASILKANAGDGVREVQMWGFGAQSHEHLKKAAKHHYERLTMHEKVFSAVTHNPSVLSGYLFSIMKLPAWVGLNGFQLLAIQHHFNQGCYHNKLQFIPKNTPVRPKPVPGNAGHMVHTAVVYSENDLPWLDEAGNYTYYTHIHNPEGEKESLQNAARLTPYGGQSVEQAMGMHFPLRGQAEVLVMYLHNDFNQPILQNSPANGLNHAPVTKDNSWSTLLKTAWGQYLEFCDRKGRESITLANAEQRNRLHFYLAKDEPSYTQLACTRGPMSFQAQDSLELHASDELTHHGEKNLHIKAPQLIDFDAKEIHLQAENLKIQAENVVSLKSQRTMEISSEALQMHANDDITLQATGNCVKVHLPNGDVLVEADELNLTAGNSLYLGCPNAGIRLAREGITLQGQAVAFAGAPDIRGPLMDASTEVPPLLIPQRPSPVALAPVKRYDFGEAKTIHPPNWQHPFYYENDAAQAEVDITGFQGNEKIVVSILRYQPSGKDKNFPNNPTHAALKEAERLDSLSFTLGEKDLYLHAKQHQESPGSATLKFPISLKRLIHLQSSENNRAFQVGYYVRVDVGDVQGQVHSNAMLILSQANVHIRHDKDFDYQQTQSILSIKRALPNHIKHHPQCPLQTELRYAQNPTRIKKLPVGHGNTLRLKENGVYREILRQDFTLPLHEQPLDISPEPEQTIELPRLMPPMIISVRNARLEGDKVVFDEQSPYARDSLTTEEIEYIKANGNNLTIFIHGYNVELGDFGYHFDALTEKIIYKASQTGIHPSLTPTKVLTGKCSETKATIYRDKKFLVRQFPELSQEDIGNVCLTPERNGTGVHSWIIDMERNLNKAAGFDEKDYKKFTRCLFITWNGNPTHSYDYITAAEESMQAGKIVAQIIHNIQMQTTGIKLHVIAHSLGNGVLLHAMEKLGEQNKEFIEHAFFWQAAIPQNALSDRNVGSSPPDLKDIAKQQATNPWYCPYAHKGAKRITVLHSKNDNILGPLISEREQPGGLKLKDVWKPKPYDELGYALVLMALGLESLYLAANQINTPISDILSSKNLEKAWQSWLKKHPTFHWPEKNVDLPCAPTLEEQYALLKSIDRQGLLTEEYLQRAKKGIKKATLLMKEYNPYIVLGCSFAMLLLGFRTPSAVIKMLVTQYWNTFDALGVITDDGGDIIVKAIVQLDFTTFLDRQSKHVQHLITFFQTTTLLNGIEIEHALGYEGPDFDNKFIKHLKASGKLLERDTTEWLWAHSHMKEPNQKIMGNIYEGWIINKLAGIKQFGHYEYEKNNSKNK